ncbi:type II secretion system minor pseudopilin GspK [Gammaproteobacteria bacterium]|nr:type II secretion system minor pseudopilin GspK [Gammaproteobacteria bacterium]
MRINNSLKNQHGAALIVALFITTLVAIVAVAMMERLNIDIRSATLINNNIKAKLYADGSIAWAIEKLNSNIKRKKQNSITDTMPIKSPKDFVEKSEIYSVIYDQERLFNLNNLSNIENHRDFIRLLKIIDPTISETKAAELTIAVHDWISPTSNNNILNEYYNKQTPSYAAAHKLMSSVSELRLIKGFDSDLYNKIIPYITVLPELTKINVNTATPQVITTLSSTLTIDAANTIVNSRNQKPFESSAIFLQSEIAKNHNISDQKITTESSYFLIQTNVKIDNQKLTIYTLLHRALNNSKPNTTVVWQSKGTL